MISLLLRYEAKRSLGFGTHVVPLDLFDGLKYAVRAADQALDVDMARSNSFCFQNFDSNGL